MVHKPTIHLGHSNASLCRRHSFYFRFKLLFGRIRLLAMQRRNYESLYVLACLWIVPGRAPARFPGLLDHALEDAARLGVVGQELEALGLVGEAAFAGGDGHRPGRTRLVKKRQRLMYG